MAKNRLCNLDWQIEKKCNGERARHMLQANLYTDCEFLVGLEDEKQSLKAHRLLLAMGSPVFEAMFYGGMAVNQSSGPIQVLDVQYGAFRDLIEFIYSEHIELKSFDQACEVCYAAKKYMVPSLVEKCSQFMWKDLFPENACRALEFANLYEDTTLKTRSMDLIRFRTREALQHSHFEDITESTLLLLVKDDDLSISETDLFEAIKRWASKECERRDLEVTPANVRQVVNNIINHIRFLTMTTEEFASGPAVSGVLTQEESFAILMNLSCRDKWPLPSHLCSSRTQRNSFVPQASTSAYQNSTLNGSPGVRSVDGDTNHSSARIYCYRNVEREIPVRNMGILDCAVSLNVDRNICIQGVVLASQISPIDEVSSEQNNTYAELLYCHLLDRDGTRLTYAHFSGRSTKRSTLDVFFNRPVYVQRNRDYRICVVLNRGGLYPLATASSLVICQGVHFRFGTLSSEHLSFNEAIRDGLILGLIFSF